MLIRPRLSRLVILSQFTTYISYWCTDSHMQDSKIERWTLACMLQTIKPSYPTATQFGTNSVKLKLVELTVGLHKRWSERAEVRYCTNLLHVHPKKDQRYSEFGHRSTIIHVKTQSRPTGRRSRCQGKDLTNQKFQNSADGGLTTGNQSG